MVGALRGNVYTGHLRLGSIVFPSGLGLYSLSKIMLGLMIMHIYFGFIIAALLEETTLNALRYKCSEAEDLLACFQSFLMQLLIVWLVFFGAEESSTATGCLKLCCRVVGD